MNVQSKSSICEPNIHGEQIYKMQFEVCFYHLLLNWDWYQSPKHFYAKDFFYVRTYSKIIRYIVPEEVARYIINSVNDTENSYHFVQRINSARNATGIDCFLSKE